MSALAAILLRAVNAVPLTRAEAVALTTCPLDELMPVAQRIRTRFFSERVGVCAIINAKSGACSEDCAFCAQAARHVTGVKPHALLSAAKLATALHKAAALPAGCVGVVTSGRDAVTGAERERLLRALREAGPRTRATLSVSLGHLDDEILRALWDAGIRRIHHNLETSRRFFPTICTTHMYDDRIATIRRAQARGFDVCCGGIFGMGETWDDRIDLALELRTLGIRAVPLNFLHPIAGTPLEHAAPLAPPEALRIIALFRCMLPDADLKIAGGREAVLRETHALIFHAGASSMMIGEYLTTAGRSVEKDLQLLADLGLTLARPHGACAAPPATPTA
jgi:biotin synthase